MPVASAPRFAILLLLLPLSLFLASCDSTQDPEVIVEDLKAGQGDEAAVGDWIRVQYAGRLENGSEFDSGTFETYLRSGAVIEGWVQGLPGMKVGGRRRLIIPPELAYGRQGVCNSAGECRIPPGATLIFEVELLEVRKPSGV